MKEKPRGIAYGIGVGPGDPELLTLKAVRLMREADVIAYPGASAEKSLAYGIAVQAVPEIAEKETLPVLMPMTRDPAALERAHREAALQIEEQLLRGKTVAYLTLGDPSIYCSFHYIKRILEADGYETCLVSGIPSFCAAADRLGIPLSEKEETIAILPGTGPGAGEGNAGADDAVLFPEAADAGQTPASADTLVIMKVGRQIREIRDRLLADGRAVYCAENCGMEGEKLCRGAEEIPEEAGYFSLLIGKRGQRE